MLAGVWGPHLIQQHDAFHKVAAEVVEPVLATLFLGTLATNI